MSTAPPPPPPPSRWDNAGSNHQPLLDKFRGPSWQEYKDVIPGDKKCFCWTTPLASFLCLVTSPLLCIPACSTPVIVNPREEAVITVFGRFFKRLKNPGLYFMNPCGRDIKVVSTKHTAYELSAVKVADGNGNPLHISGVVTYHVRDSAKAALDVTGVPHYLSKQAHAVLKRIASSYPYETQHGEPSLKTEVQSLQSDMARMLQERVDVAGIYIEGFNLTEISYSPEIAPAMLVRQQAQALVDARSTIVAGAVQISAGALDALGERGVPLSDDLKGRLINNILTVICGETRVQTVIPVSMESAAA